MVLQIDGVNIQPTKEGFFPRQEAKVCVGQYYIYSVFAVRNFAFGVGAPGEAYWDCTERKDKFTLEFGYLLTPEQRLKRATVIISNSEGKRFTADVDLSTIR
jgi:hypothetical protein